MDIEGDVWADGEQDALAEIAALSGACAAARSSACANAHPHAARRCAADDIVRRTRLLENEIRVLKDESTRLGLEQQGNKEKVKDNLDKIKLNRQLPYLVGNVVVVRDQVPVARAARRARRGRASGCATQP